MAEKGFELWFSAYHNSRGAGTDLGLGPNWSYSFMRQVRLLDPTTARCAQDDGTEVDFKRGEDGTWRPVTAGYRLLLERKDDGWLMTFPSKEKERYDAEGRLTELADPFGNTARVRRDAQGRIKWIEDPNGRSLVFYYNAQGRLTSVEDTTETDAWTEFHFDPQGRVARIFFAQDPASTEYRFGYDNAGRIVQMTPPQGGPWWYRFTAQGRVDRFVSPLGGATQIRYALEGLRVRTEVTRPREAVAAYCFDPTGRIESVTDPLGGVHRFSFNAGNRLTRYTDPEGNVTTLAYDTRDNPTKDTDPLGYSRSFRYDAWGNVVATTDGLGNTMVFQYERPETGRPTAVILPPDGEGNGPATSRATFDPTGNLTSFRDPLDVENRFVHDPANGRLLVWEEGVEGASNNFREEYRYDSAGFLSDVIRVPGARDVVPSFFPAIPPWTAPSVQTGSPQSDQAQAPSLTYEPTDSHVNWDGEFTAVSYDVTTNLPGDPSPSSRTTVAERDPLGRPQKLVFRSTELCVNQEREYRYSYDDANGTVTEERPDGSRTVWTRDLAGRTVSLVDGAFSIEQTYTPSGRLERVTRKKNGIVCVRTDYTYHPNGWLKTIRHQNAQGSDLLVLDYSYDPNGNVSRVIENGSALTEYRHDNRGQLVEEKRTGPGAYWMTYRYDQNGNRLEKTERDPSGGIRSRSVYHYDIETPELYGGSFANRLRWTEERDGMSGACLEKTFFYYEPTGFGNVTAVATWDTKDPRTLRVERLFYNNAGHPWLVAQERCSLGEDGVTVTGRDVLDIHEGRQFFANRYYAGRRSPQGLPLPRGSSWSDRLGGSICEHRKENEEFLPDSSIYPGFLRIDRRTETASFPLGDLVGTERVRIDDQGRVLGAGLLSAFGEPVSRTGDESASNFVEDTGAERIPNTSWIRMGERYYDPRTGRFLQRDPLGPLGGANTYAYCLNSPSAANDPAGLDRRPRRGPPAVRPPDNQEEVDQAFERVAIQEYTDNIITDIETGMEVVAVATIFIPGGPGAAGSVILILRSGVVKLMSKKAMRYLVREYGKRAFYRYLRGAVTRARIDVINKTTINTIQEIADARADFRKLDALQRYLTRLLR